MDYGKLVKDERKAARMSLAKLSELSGVAPTTISNWENGHEPPAEKLDKVLAALRISITLGKQS